MVWRTDIQSPHRVEPQHVGGLFKHRRGFFAVGMSQPHHSHSLLGGDQVDKAKPDPEIYLKSATALGFDACQCVAFEDSGHGTMAALASGAKTVQVPDMIAPYTGAGSSDLVVADTVWQGAVAIGLIDA